MQCSVLSGVACKNGNGYHIECGIGCAFKSSCAERFFVFRPYRFHLQRITVFIHFIKLNPHKTDLPFSFVAWSHQIDKLRNCNHTDSVWCEAAVADEMSDEQNNIAHEKCLLTHVWLPVMHKECNANQTIIEWPYQRPCQWSRCFFLSISVFLFSACMTVTLDEWKWQAKNSAKGTNATTTI